MDINNSIANRPQFNGVRISKNTLQIMDSRGELGEFNKILPDLKRKGKKANITVYAVNRQVHCMPYVTYGMSIRPINRLKDNVVTKLLGLSKNKQGDSFISVNSGRATENLFRNLYDTAYKNRNYKRGISYSQTV